MNDYRHHVSGFFTDRDDAESAYSTLVERGLPRERLQIIETDSAASAPKAGSTAVLKDVLVDGTIGTAVGTGIGALAEVVLMAAHVSLFASSPLLASLGMLGWGAGIGGLIGVTTGAIAGTASRAENKVWLISALVRDATSSRQIVLVVDNRTEQDTEIAREVIQASVGDY